MNDQVASNGKRSKKHILKFFSIVFGIVFAFVILASISVFGYLKMNAKSSMPIEVVEEQQPIKGTIKSTSQAIIEEEKPEKGGFMQDIFLPPQKTTFLITGLDQNEALADVIIVGCFDRPTEKITLLSVPRDTYVQLKAEDLKSLRDLDRHPPSSGVVKMNQVHSYAGKKHGQEYTIKVLEDLLGITIDYNVEVNLKAFRDIVTAIGGVEMDIRPQGLYYKDPEQNLYINVPGGRQVLDASMAEGVVRYRNDYPRGDIDRIDVQHDFLKAFFEQALQKDVLIKNAASFASTIISYVKTDFGITDVPKYARYIDSLKADNLSLVTLPGDDTTINKASYFIVDMVEAQKLVEEIFFSTTEEEPIPEATETPATSAPTTVQKEEIDLDIGDVKVQVLNGGAPSGTATVKGSELSDSGYNVLNIGNYTGTQQDKTRIMVRKQEIATGLAEFFTSPVVEVDGELPSQYDVVIIIGKKEI